MKQHTSKRIAAVLFLLGCAVLASIEFWGAGFAAPQPEEKDTAVARKAEVDPAAALRAKLAERVDLPNGFDANTPLKDALDFITETYGLPIMLDEDAFNAIEVQKVGEQAVRLPKLKNVRLSTMLRLLLKQVKGNRYYGTFIVRSDIVEVTTTYVVLTEALGVEGLNEEAAADEEPSRGVASAERVVSIDVRLAIDSERAEEARRRRVQHRPRRPRRRSGRHSGERNAGHGLRGHGGAGPRGTGGPEGRDAEQRAVRHDAGASRHDVG